MESAGTAAAPPGDTPRLDPANILWFFGGLTATAASDAVLSRVHPSARGVWILLASLAFLAAFGLVSVALLRAGWVVPGGVLAAMAVTFVVPAGIGLERLIGFWRTAPGLSPLQEYEGPVFALALAVVLAAVIVFALVRFPFVLAVAAAGTVAGAQLLAPVALSRPSLADHATASIVIGGALIVVGVALDLARARREAFWWHVFGLEALAVGLAYHAFRHASWGWVLILALGAAFLLLATFLRRATWGLFGLAGFYAPIVHYLDRWFGNLGTAFALAALGLALVGLGIASRLAPAARAPVDA